MAVKYFLNVNSESFDPWCNDYTPIYSRIGRLCDYNRLIPAAWAFPIYCASVVRSDKVVFSKMEILLINQIFPITIDWTVLGFVPTVRYIDYKIPTPVARSKKILEF